MSAQFQTQFPHVEAATEPSNPGLAFLPNLFLLNPFNRGFISGKSKRIEVDPVTYYIPALLFLVTVVGYFFLPTMLTLIFAIVTLYTTRRAFQLNQWVCHLSACRRLVKGEVTNCFVEQGSYGGIRSHHIKLCYRFQAVDGHPIEAEKSLWTILDSARWEFRAPKPGTPLAVLYVNDSLYEVL